MREPEALSELAVQEFLDRLAELVAEAVLNRGARDAGPKGNRARDAAGCEPLRPGARAAFEVRK